MTVSALPASRENRELIAPPTMIGLRARRLFVRGFACLLLGVLLSIATVAAAHFWLQHQVAASTPSIPAIDVYTSGAAPLTPSEARPAPRSSTSMPSTPGSTRPSARDR